MTSMRSKQKLTNIDRRKLTYDKQIQSVPNKTLNNNSSLDLPAYLEHKISSNQHQKLKEAFFVEASPSLKLTRQKFPIVMRSMGIIEKTSKFYEIFSQLQDKQMSWQQFLQAYISKRHLKGSYNELSSAVHALDQQYHGNWDELFLDLHKLGDVLSPSDIQILKKDILKGKTVTSEVLINSLLGYK